MAAWKDAEELHKQVYDLTKQGKSAELKVLLNDHLDVDVDEYRDDEYDWRALDIACVDGHTECTRLLIDHKADVNAKDEGSPAALHNAADSKQLDLVELLVQHGADVNCLDEQK
jgi:ankyrin repeat protein